MSMDDKDFLQWIYDRLEAVHGENPHMDYMHKLRSIIGAMPDGTFTPNVPALVVGRCKLCNAEIADTDNYQEADLHEFRISHPIYVAPAPRVFICEKCAKKRGK